MTSAICPRFLRLPLMLSLPLCLALAGCGTSISNTNSSTVSAVTVTLSATPTTIASTGTTTLTATVTNNAGASIIQPTGNVTFSGNNGITLGVGKLSLNNDGVSSTATLTVEGAALAASNSITANYYGDNFHSGGSSSPVTVTVSGTGGGGGAIATSTALTASSLNISTSQSTTLTATVTAGSGTAAPTGQVAFVDITSSVTLGTGQLIAGTGLSSTAAIIVSGTSLLSGANVIAADYDGSSTFATSTSTQVTVTVGTGGGGGATVTSTTIAANPTTIAPDGLTVLTATISSGAKSGNPSGTVKFVDQTNGATLGTANVTATSTAGQGSAVLSASGGVMSNGANLIVAEYSGDNTFAASSSASITVTVSSSAGGGPGTSIVGASPASVTVVIGSGICPNVNINITGNGTATPTGRVTLSVNNVTLGYTILSGGYQNMAYTGWAVCAQGSTPLASPGDYSMLITYSGDGNYTASNTTVAVTVEN